MGAEYKNTAVSKVKTLSRSNSKKNPKISEWLRDEEYLMGRIIMMLKKKKKKRKLAHI